MKSLFFAQTLIIGLLMAPTTKTLAADGYNRTDRGNDVVTPSVQLAARIYPAGQTKNQFTLTLVRPETEPAEIRILGKDGTVVNRVSVKESTAFCRLDMTDLNPGQYTVQIRSGRQFREEKVTVQ